MNVKFEHYKNLSENSELMVENDAEYSIYDKIRVYYDGKLMYEESIHADGEGNLYYEVRNPYSKNSSFSNRPKDAIKAISEGYGDAFVRKECLGMNVTFESVYRYIDRNYGDMVRRQTLEMFDGAAFEYAVRFGIKGCKDGMRYVDKNHHLVSIESGAEANSFANEADATKYLETTLRVASNNFNKLKASLKGPTDVTGLVEWLDNSEFGKDCKYTPDHIAYAVFFAMLQEWQENKSNTYTFEVVQTIKS